jgi:K+-sensing histidine kinase KdpD
LLICIVSDTGIGVKNDQRKNLFNAQMNNINRGNLNNGSNQIGLGLFISMQLVKSYNGKLDFVSNCQEPNRGSSFIFTFGLDVHEYSRYQNNSG